METLIAPILDFCVTLPMGFKARVVLSPACLLACAGVNLRVTSGVTAAFFHQ